MRRWAFSSFPSARLLFSSTQGILHEGVVCPKRLIQRVPEVCDWAWPLSIRVRLETDSILGCISIVSLGFTSVGFKLFFRFLGGPRSISFFNF
jgi:hypothetical protein